MSSNPSPATHAAEPTTDLAASVTDPARRAPRVGWSRRFAAAGAGAILVTGFLAAAPVQAKHGSDDGGSSSASRVVKSGDCTGRTDWKLKAKPDDGALEVEFEVDSNRNGKRWAWTIRHDGKPVASGTRRTKAPSGSFTVERRVRNAPGKHTISATARNAKTGEVCRAQVRI